MRKASKRVENEASEQEERAGGGHSALLVKGVAMMNDPQTRPSKVSTLRRGEAQRNKKC